MSHLIYLRFVGKLVDTTSRYTKRLIMKNKTKTKTKFIARDSTYIQIDSHNFPTLAKFECSQ
jgi:hypothetical protein